MYDDFIGRQIQRTNRNLFVLGLTFLGVIAIVCASTWRDTHNVLFGPFAADAQQLASIADPNAVPRYYLKIQADSASSAEFQEVNSHNRVTAEVMVLAVGDRLLLAKTPSTTDQLSFKGTIGPVPSELRDGIINLWDQKHPEARGAFLPYMLDATGIWNSDTICSAALELIIGIIGLAFVGIALYRWAQPAKHPLLKRLQTYGLLNDVRMRIDSELRSEGGGERFGKFLHITSNWVVQAPPYKTDVMQTRDVIWAYEKVTQQRHNGVPVRKIYSAILRDSKGRSMEVTGKRDSVPVLLQSLQRRMPWILVGFSKDLETLWKKQRPQFFQMMEQRRAKLATATR
jgi:hypothetical protein